MPRINSWKWVPRHGWRNKKQKRSNNFLLPIYVFFVYQKRYFNTRIMYNWFVLRKGGKYDRKRLPRSMASAIAISVVFFFFVYLADINNLNTTRKFSSN